MNSKKSTDRFKQHLSKELKYQIFKFDIKKKDFAESLGVSPVYMTKITRHTNKVPSPKRLREIIDLFPGDKRGAVEKKLENIVDTYADIDYRAEYYIAKLQGTFYDQDSFIEFLSNEVALKRRE